MKFSSLAPWLQQKCHSEHTKSQISLNWLKWATKERNVISLFIGWIFSSQSWGGIQKVSWASQGSIIGVERAHWGRNDAVPTAMLPPSLECFLPSFLPTTTLHLLQSSWRPCARWKLMGWEAMWVQTSRGEWAQSTSRCSWLKYSKVWGSRLHLYTQVGRWWLVALQGSWQNEGDEPGWASVATKIMMFEEVETWKLQSDNHRFIFAFPFNCFVPVYISVAHPSPFCWSIK